jgi:hypothetical protein
MPAILWKQSKSLTTRTSGDVATASNNNTAAVIAALRALRRRQRCHSCHNQSSIFTSSDSSRAQGSSPFPYNTASSRSTSSTMTINNSDERHVLDVVVPDSECGSLFLGHGRLHSSPPTATESWGHFVDFA